MQTLTAKSLESLFRKITGLQSGVFGEFEYRGIRIVIKKPKLLLGRERSKKLYEFRRSRGLCVHCGLKVRRSNPLTGQPYRLCDVHRTEELKRKKQIRRKRRTRPSV